MRAKLLFFAICLLLCSCVEKDKYDNAISENEELTNQIAILQSEIISKDNQISQLESSLKESQENVSQYYDNSTTNQDKGKAILEELSIELNNVQKILNNYTSNDDIYKAYKYCKDMEANVDSYLFYKY